jgi:hypothetical protein
MSADFEFWGGAKARKLCSSQKILQDEYLLAKFGFDTSENGPQKKFEKL